MCVMSLLFWLVVLVIVFSFFVCDQFFMFFCVVLSDKFVEDGELNLNDENDEEREALFR